MTKPTPTHIVEEILRLHATHQHTNGQIADMFGISTSTVVRYLSMHGKTRRVGLNEDETRHAQQLLDAGCSYREVARTLNRDKQLISRHFPGRGWSKSDGALYGQTRARMRRAGLLI